ncbi:hypothetical protein VNO77_34280 [Canavalia gladiata]|uniref:Uncharacterized protein n=1 Tax=Canavalia gladiata TaxID=3824 RepID=A0AAN9KGF9_CANGL
MMNYPVMVVHPGHFLRPPLSTTVLILLLPSLGCAARGTTLLIVYMAYLKGSREKVLQSFLEKKTERKRSIYQRCLVCCFQLAVFIIVQCMVRTVLKWCNNAKV